MAAMKSLYLLEHPDKLKRIHSFPLSGGSITYDFVDINAKQKPAFLAVKY